MGHVLSPSASAAIIRFSQANDVLFIAHFNKSCRNTGGIPIVFHKFTSRKIAHLTAPKMPNGPGMNRIRPIFAVRSYSRTLAWLKPLLRIHCNWACEVAASDPMSATATTSADAVAAGICPRQSFAAVAFLGDDSTQKNRYGCILKLEGAWRAASRICSRSTCGISTGSKALTARLWKSASRISLMGTSMLLLQHKSVVNATYKRNAGATIGSILRYSENDSGPEVGLGEISIDLPQARIWPTSGLPTNFPESDLRTDHSPPRLLRATTNGLPLAERGSL